MQLRHDYQVCMGVNVGRESEATDGLQMFPVKRLALNAVMGTIADQ